MAINGKNYIFSEDIVIDYHNNLGSGADFSNIG